MRGSWPMTSQQRGKQTHQRAGQRTRTGTGVVHRGGEIVERAATQDLRVGPVSAIGFTFPTARA